MTQKKKKKKPIWKRYKLVLPGKQKAPVQTTGEKRTVVRHRLRLRKEVIYVLLGIAALLCLIFIPRSIQSSNLKKLGYNKEEIKAIREQKLASRLLDNSYYSPYLASCIKDKSVNTDYLNFYAIIKGDRTLSAQDFLLIHRLREKGYTDGQIENMYKSLKFYEMTPLLVFDYQYNEQAYIDDCKNHADNSPNNFTLSGNYYTPYLDTHPVDDESSVEMLVNKSYYLSESYVPANLTGMSNWYAAEGRELAGVAADAFKELCDGGRAVGVTFYTTSSYRSYEQQDALYKSYVQAYGQERTDELSARPGFSEHQTGFTVDVAATNEDDKTDFEQTNAYRWLSMNCMDFGWILRYPDGKKDITGYDFESWHYRYVGKDVARAVYEKNMTFDEFYMLYLKPWSSDDLKPSDAILKATDFRAKAEPEPEETPNS